MTELSCSHGHSIQVQPEQAGSEVRCPQCQETVSVPAQLETAIAPAAALAATQIYAANDTEELGADSRTVAKPPAKRSSTRWIWMTAGALSALGVTILVAFEAWNWQARHEPDQATGSTQNDPQDQADRLPRVPGAVSRLPDWLIKEAPFDLQEAFAPIPPEENAAGLYLTAFVEFSSEMAICFPEDQRDELRKRAKGRYDRMYPGFLARWDMDAERFRVERTEMDNSKLDTLLAEYDRGFEILARAQAMQKCVFETGIDLTALLPHVQSCREVARIVKLRMMRELDRGEMDQALDSIATVLQLSRDLRPRGPLISQLVANALDNIAYQQMIPMFLTAPGCTAADCDRLSKLLIDHKQRSLDPVATGAKTEYVMVRRLLHDAQHRTGAFAPENIKELADSFGIKDADSVGAVLMSVFYGSVPNSVELRQIDSHFELMSDDDYANDAKALNHFFKTVHELAQQSDREQQQLLLDDLKRQSQASIFLSLALPSVINSLEPFTRTKAQLNGTQCLTALRRWQLDQKGVPDDLESVMKYSGFNTVPDDPYSGQPLKMNVIDGQPVIYSVGQDRKDDLGRVDWKFGTIPGDFIFRLE